MELGSPFPLSPSLETSRGVAVGNTKIEYCSSSFYKEQMEVLFELSNYINLTLNINLDLKLHGGWGYWTMNYTGAQSFLTTFSYCWLKNFGFFH